MGFEQLGALQNEIEKCCMHVASALTPPALELARSYRMPLAGGLLLYGNSGTGKTSLCGALARYVRSHPSLLAHPILLSCSNLVTQQVSAICRYLVTICQEAVVMRPSLIIFDDIDRLMPPPAENDAHSNLRTSQIVEMFTDLMTSFLSRYGVSSRGQAGGIAIVATARSGVSFHPMLQLPPLFTCQVELPSPNAHGRQEIIEKILKAKRIPYQVDLEALAAETEGYMGSDLNQLIERIIHASASRSFRSRSTLEIREVDVREALDGFVPASLKDIPLQPSSTSWQDIGGLVEVREVLKETLEMPTRYARLFETAPLKLRSGILLYGPPGCGKTMLASAVAKECGINFISIKGPELLNKYIGASEQSVRDVFGRAAAASPCVVFFDEFEAIAPRRGADSTGVTDRVVNQLLCHLDGVEGRSGVYVLAATSRPDLIDPALLRPGRLDKALYCGVPDATDRLQILQAVTRKMKIADDVDLEKIAESCVNYTGADLQALVTTAQLNAVHELLEQQIQQQKTAPEEGKTQNAPSLDAIPLVRGSHFANALENTRLSVPEKERKKFEQIYANFVGSRQANFSLDQREGKLRTALA
eukprot:TRINITY_DN12362_c0_g1_i2.p1 TRINITY_DN12362_c0_g1~~TRINITY_DN12362_c0_g1_i2.p1  ORF type:complete len:624 (-),score=80.66 TRINITY_DN12362_c0_g1_i2:68-1837(-)